MKSLLGPLSRKHLWNFFFELAWEFCIEKRRGFVVICFFFSGLCFSRNDAPKPLNLGLKQFGQNSGPKFGAKFGELSFCNFLDLSNRSEFFLVLVKEFLFLERFPLFFFK